MDSPPTAEIKTSPSAPVRTPCPPGFHPLSFRKLPFLFWLLLVLSHMLPTSPMSSLSPAFFILPSLPTGSQASSQAANSSLTHHVYHPLSQNVELTKIDCCVLSTVTVEDSRPWFWSTPQVTSSPHGWSWVRSLGTVATAIKTPQQEPHQDPIPCTGLSRVAIHVSSGVFWGTWYNSHAQGLPSLYLVQPSQKDPPLFCTLSVSLSSKNPDFEDSLFC